MLQWQALGGSASVKLQLSLKDKWSHLVTIHCQTATQGILVDHTALPNSC